MKKHEHFDELIDSVIDDQITNETAIAFWVHLKNDIKAAEKNGGKSLLIDDIINRFEQARIYGKNKKQ